MTNAENNIKKIANYFISLTDNSNFEEYFTPDKLTT